MAGRGPNKNNLTGKIERDGKQVDVVSPDGTPIGPGCGKQYLLGADTNGRDVMVRLLYGGRNSLFVGLHVGAASRSSSRCRSACSPATSAARPTS